MNILLVEDDLDIMEILGMYLQTEGMNVSMASNVASAYSIFLQKKPDLLLTDIILPDGTGLDLAQKIREISSIPIIFVSCKKEPQDIIDALRLGGDDYVTKPFDYRVIVARVSSQLRRAHLNGFKHKEAATPVWSDYRLKIDARSMKVEIHGHPVALYAKELKLLLFLVEHANQVFSVEQLYENIWGWNKESSHRTVMVHIRNLRKKIEENPNDPQYILTIRGFGYKFCWPSP
ncbi:response regulator transcription factor [Ammoniphilus sp. CFH 90114]|uniref:response regulator transcription factor n=1 Tax=Ammoniphilus sp. CFH 90114 TaxID=2493665 RepID=UPI00100F0CE9|nr:response regulator transcription factor [Ammoniphilus sp. CFH 90114]RXT13601.1 response regulator transcription factor [Ammoniphilus sp. CFH 90114]